MNRKINILVPLALLISACASQKASQIVTVTSIYNKDVCVSLGMVEGRSSLGEGLGGGQKAKIEALENAANLNATHIVWVNERPDGERAEYRSARAYKCEDKRTQASLIRKQLQFENSEKEFRLIIEEEMIQGNRLSQKGTMNGKRFTCSANLTEAECKSEK